jgi:hypothetical protein
MKITFYTLQGKSPIKKNTFRSFSVHTIKYMDRDEALERELEELREQQEREREERNNDNEEKNSVPPTPALSWSGNDDDDEREMSFLRKSERKIEKLKDKQEEIEGELLDRIHEGYENLSFEKGEKVLTKFMDIREKVKENTAEKAEALEAEFKDDLKPVAYFSKKVDIEATGFKKLTQVLEKEEEAIHKELKKEQYYEDNQHEYETERSEWKERHRESVRECRQDKKDIKEILESNLEKPSEMAEDLLNESGPDYTGGDD